MRVDFYILSDPAPGAREQMSCRIAEKAYRMGHRVYLLADSEAHAGRVDELLWTFRDGSFVPHARLAEGIEPAPPVLVGSDRDGAPAADVMINLTGAVPPCFGNFERIAEVIDAGEEGRRAGRERFRFYRDKGLDPQTHQI